MIYRSSRTAEDRYFLKLYQLRKYIENFSPRLEKKILEYYRFRYKEEMFKSEGLGEVRSLERRNR